MNELISNFFSASNFSFTVPLFELISRKSAQAAVQAAGGALVTFLVGTMLKLAVCALAIYTILAN